MTVLPLTLLAALQPAPPPPADRVAAALAVWQSHPLSSTVRQEAIDRAVGSAANQAIADAKAKNSYRYYYPLKQRLKAHLPADLRAIDDQALSCLVDDLAYHLSADDLRAIQAFVTTQAGGRFWNAEVISWERLSECYRAPVAFALGPDVDADLKALGLKRPLPDPRRPSAVN